MAKVDNGASRINTPPLPMRKAPATTPPVNLGGAAGDALEACAEGLDVWRLAGPSPASRALESLVGETIAALSRPITDDATAALARSIRSASEAARLSPREGPRASTFRHGELARVWRAVTAAASVADGIRTARAFVVAAYETRGFNPRGTPYDSIGDRSLVTCGRCYSAEVWPAEDAGCSQCGALLSAPVTLAPCGGYHGALVGLGECRGGDETVARYALGELGFNPHLFSRGDRTARSRRISGKSKL